jgi:hypothetical protein
MGNAMNSMYTANPIRTAFSVGESLKGAGHIGITTRFIKVNAYAIEQPTKDSPENQKSRVKRTSINELHRKSGVRWCDLAHRPNLEGQNLRRQNLGTRNLVAAYLSLYLDVGENLMSKRVPFISVLEAIILLAAILFFECAEFHGQNSDVNLALHAKSHASAADIGLPAYPGATLYKDGDNSAADLGLTAGDFHFSLLAVNYITSDPAAKVLAFYRKPLSRYGEVLECNQGKPIGALTATRSGLTCDDGGKSNSNDSHELRVGTPHQYRIVGIDNSHPGSTRFGLVYLDLPKDSGDKTN